MTDKRKPFSESQTLCDRAYTIALEFRGATLKYISQQDIDWLAGRIIAEFEKDLANE